MATFNRSTRNNREYYRGYFDTSTKRSAFGYGASNRRGYSLRGSFRKVRNGFWVSEYNGFTLRYSKKYRNWGLYSPSGVFMYKVSFYNLVRGIY